jgi:hypothetical protein
VIYADTSLLFSLYALDANTSAAIKLYESDRRRPLLLTPWQRFELRSTVRLAAHKFSRAQQPVPFEVGNVLKQVDDDLKAGVLRHAEPDWRETFRVAEEISANYTVALGQGGADTWHLAAAVLLRADSFWTFDAAQAAAARDCGNFKRVRAVK